MATVYLLHFSQPLGNPGNARALASHYIGWASDLGQRLAEHRAGRGAAITRAAVARGISFECVATWPGDRQLERYIKSLKVAPRLCPHCGRRHQRGPRCLVWHQLELELFDPFDISTPAPARADWYEISYLRRANRWQPPSASPPLVLQDTSDLDIPF